MASRFSRPGRAACLALALVALALLLGASSACVREVIQPVTESTLVVARSANDVTLSWHAIGGMYYTLLYARSQGADADWKAMDGAVNLRATASGPVEIHDHISARVPRYYRLLQDRKPIPLTRQ